MYRRRKWVVWAPENSVVSCKTRGVRYISPIRHGVPRGYGRHRSPHAHTVTNQSETNRPCTRHIDAAPIGREAPYLDVEARVEHALDNPKIDAERPAAARRPLHVLGISDLLGHRAHQCTQTSRPEAKNTAGSKLRSAGHDLWPAWCLPGRARWLEAHRVRKPRPRHGRALSAARTHVCDITLMLGFNRSARI